MNKEELLSGLESDVTMIDFWAQWCVPCKMIGPTLDKIDEENPRVSLLKLNVDDEENKGLLEEFSIRSIPTVILVNKSGEVLDRMTGNQTKEKIQEILSNHI